MAVKMAVTSEIYQLLVLMVPCRSIVVWGEVVSILRTYSSWVSSGTAVTVFSKVPSPVESIWRVTPSSPWERAVQSIVY